MKTFKDLPEYNKSIKTMTYAGIGGRNTPVPIMQKMNQISKYLESIGYTLRSGNAFGADKAFAGQSQPFEKSYDGSVIKWSDYKHKVKKCEIFTAKDSTDEVRGIAKEIHPYANNLKSYVLDLHARNTFQIFGIDLNTPVDFVVCWTSDGCEHHNKRTQRTGGTGQAISIASLKGIPIVNMANSDWRDRLIQLIKQGEHSEHG